MKAKIFDDSMSMARRSFSRISDDSRGWTEGAVMTPFGAVLVYAQGDERHDKHSRLDFVWRNRFYMRKYERKRLTKRGLARAANAFAREIAERAT